MGMRCVHGSTSRGGIYLDTEETVGSHTMIGHAEILLKHYFHFGSEIATKDHR
jgi:hypothetical protein